MTKLERYFPLDERVGCPRGQMENFVRVDVVPQERQLAASAAARLCDRADGPIAVGYGGARGGGSRIGSWRRWAPTTLSASRD